MDSQVTAVVGAQWGDEGKGKIVDALASRHDIVARFQGGDNAGHTINNDYGRFSLHLLPSGVFHSNVQNIIGPGVALNLKTIRKELSSLRERGVPAPTLWISDRAQIVMPHHILLDQYEEERLDSRKYGSTVRGISPFYSDKARKKGIQVCQLFDQAALVSHIEEALLVPNLLFRHLYCKPGLEVSTVMESLMEDAEALMPLVRDTAALQRAALESSKTVLLEGQLGALRDIDHGIYPFTTSSSPLAGYASVGAGVAPHLIRRVVAVVKAYSSKVGSGPFVTQISDSARSDKLRGMGGDRGEYGATTGRPRDVGWFDAVATKYGVQTQGATEIALTNLDVLGYLERIPVCTGYRLRNGVTSEFPTMPELAGAEPVYEELPGWGWEKERFSRVESYGDLPANARRYIERLEVLLGAEIKLLSTGPQRSHLIEK